LEKHGKAAVPTTITFPRVCVIHLALTVSSLETLVSAQDSGSSPLSLTSILVVSSFGRAVLDEQVHNFENFTFSIPPTGFQDVLGGVGCGDLAGVDPSLVMTRIVEGTRH